MTKFQRFINKVNRFAGADDIYLTKKNIAVRKVSTFYDKNGKFHMTDTTKYYKKTAKNLANAKSIHGYIRYGRG